MKPDQTKLSSPRHQPRAQANAETDDSAPFPLASSPAQSAKVAISTAAISIKSKTTTTIERIYIKITQIPAQGRGGRGFSVNWERRKWDRH